jgi:hypothetical protein
MDDGDERKDDSQSDMNSSTSSSGGGVMLAQVSAFNLTSINFVVVSSSTTARSDSYHQSPTQG